MRLVVLILYMSLLSWANQVVADCAGKACSDVYVDRLYIQGQGPIYVGTSGDETLLNCTAVSKVYLTLEPSEPNANQIYALLRGAQMEDKKIFLRIVDNSSNCKIQHMIVDR